MVRLGTWFVGVGGDCFDGCWCSMMVCRCIGGGGGGGSGLVILGVWFVVCWCLLAMVLAVVFRCN